MAKHENFIDAQEKPFRCKVAALGKAIERRTHTSEQSSSN
jgi:hypothetical protein